jgi:hypothetical protein
MTIFFAFQVFAAICEFTAIHKTAFAKLLQLKTQRQAVKVILAHDSLLIGV